jgi:hypothetical protein
MLENEEVEKTETIVRRVSCERPLADVYKRPKYRNFL